MNQYAIYLDAVQFRALRARVCRFLRRHPAWRRRRGPARLTVATMLRLILLTYRHNLRQRLLAALFGLHQSTVCRILAWMRRLLRAVLGTNDLPALVSRLLAGDGRPVILLVDGTLVPVSERRHNHADYSGKHRRAGKNLQIVSDVRGKLLYAGPAAPGRSHDRRAVAASGIETALADPRLLVHADKGYIGTGFIVPTRPSKHHPLTAAQRLENREINVIRAPVERSIAHLKVLEILRSGIRSRSPQRQEVIAETIAVAVGLVFFRQRWADS